MLETVWGLEVYEQETHLGSVFYSGIRTPEKIAVCFYCLGDWLSYEVYCDLN